MTIMTQADAQFPLTHVKILYVEGKPKGQVLYSSHDCHCPQKRKKLLKSEPYQQRVLVKQIYRGDQVQLNKAHRTMGQH